MKSSMETRLKHIIPHNFVNNRQKYTKLAHIIGHDPPCWFMLIYIGNVTLRMKARLKHIIYYKFVKKNPYHAKLAHLSQLDILHRLVPLCSVTWPHTWKRGWMYLVASCRMAFVLPNVLTTARQIHIWLSEFRYKNLTNHCPMSHSTGTRRIKQILRGLHLRSYLVHIINNFANLWYWFHVFIFACILEQGQKMKIATTAILYIQSWKSYWVSMYIVLLSIPMEFLVRLHLHHTHHHSQHTGTCSGNLQSTDRDQYGQVRLFDTDNGC